MDRNDAWPPMEIGASIQLQLSIGQQLTGTVEAIAGEWLHLRVKSRLLAVSRSQVALIALEGNIPKAGGRQRKSTTLDDPTLIPAEDEPNVPDDATLRKVVMAILDGIEGPELRAIGGMNASRLARVRQAFECARGNLQIEDLSPVARDLVDPIRRALGG